MSKPMKPADASRIQSVEAKKNNGKVSKDDFAARAQSAAEKNKKKKN
jgi:Seed maturation protein.